MTKGWRTSEFWVSVATALGGLLVAAGVITPEAVTELTQQVGVIAGGIISVISAVGYIISRAWLKKNASAAPEAGK